MQNINLKSAIQSAAENLIGESRFVFKEGAGPSATPGTAPAATERPKTPEAESGSTARGALAAEVQNEKRQEIQEQTGIDMEALKNEPTPDNLDTAIQKLLSVFGKMTENLFALFGFPPEETKDYINAPPREPTGKQIPIEAPKTEGWADRKHETLSRGNITRFEDAELKLNQNPTWRKIIEETAARTGISAGTIVGIIEMESCFNPNARPIDPKTKEPDMRVFGMAQAREAAITDYKKDGHPDADLMNPETAIDFVAWYCITLMQRVHTAIETDIKRPEQQRRGFKGEYALNEQDVKNLYLAYNQGAEGYLLLRRYKDPANTPEQTEKYKNELKNWQTRTRTYKGKVMFESEFAMNYTARDVDKIAKAYDALHGNENISLEYQPLKGNFRITDRGKVGIRVHPKLGKTHLHNGIDLAAQEGTPVIAVKNGKVELTAENDKSGEYIILRHNDGSITEYCHLSSINTSAGATLNAGQEIGKVGSTGLSTGPHLHFIYKDQNGNIKNPEAAILAARQA